MIRRCATFFHLPLLCAGISGCTATNYSPPWQSGQPYVSARQGGQAYVSSHPSVNEAELIAAYDALRNEDATQQQPAPTTAQGNLGVAPDLVLAHIWGLPPESMGRGETLLPTTLRRRLNDALNSTPVGQDVEWRYINGQFRFLPNSEIYIAHHSGGRCRDGILVMKTETDNFTKRGLFCQPGPGADWLLLK